MTHKEILDFWFQNEKKWFNWWDDFDQEITKKFIEDFEKASLWEYDTWQENPKSLLALIILLDQFSRNIFRWDKKAFEYDFKALYFTKLWLKKWFLDKLEDKEKIFFIMSLMHSESLEDQELCVQLFEELSKENDLFKNNVKFAIEHRDIVKKFGRFPHRNKVLWRQSTPEEIEFLKVHNWF